MPRLPKPPIEVPFDLNGNQLDYAWNGNPRVSWRTNYEFTTTMEIKDFLRGRSAAGWSLVDETGKTYYMFMSELLKVLQTKTIEKGVVEGKWTFVKRGQNFSVKLVE